jgi:hypothetical protein
MAYSHNGVLFSDKDEWNFLNMKLCHLQKDEIWDYHVKWNKSDSETQVSCVFSCMQNLDFKTRKQKTWK